MQNSLSRAAKYGDGLFETIRVSNKKILFAENHFQRLSTGLNALALNQNSFSFEQFLEILEKAIEKESDMNLRIRVTFFRSDGGLYTPQKHSFDYHIEISPLSDALFQSNIKGLQVGICQQVRLSTDICSNLKTISALPYVMAGIEKKANHWDEILLLNHREAVAESMAANLFVYKDNTLYTPALSEGCIAGVMRRQILHLATKNQIATQETSLKLQDLQEAQAVFLTNAIQGIQWIEQVVDTNKKSYYNRNEYPAIVALLLNELNQLILS